VRTMPPMLKICRLHKDKLKIRSNEHIRITNIKNMAKQRRVGKTKENRKTAGND
jgi:hypothetical protein